jgi:6-phosphogluconolactonase/glucosamine-6-phosphate isomerase/deaminase
MLSEYYFSDASPFATLQREYAKQLRTITLDFDECPSSGEFGVSISDTFRTEYESDIFTAGACTASGPTTTTTTYGSITQTETLTVACPGAGKVEYYRSVMTGNTADLATYTPAFVTCKDNWIWLSNLVNAVVTAEWL